MFRKILTVLGPGKAIRTAAAIIDIIYAIIKSQTTKDDLEVELAKQTTQLRLLAAESSMSAKIVDIYPDNIVAPVFIEVMTRHSFVIVELGYDNSVKGWNHTTITARNYVLAATSIYNEHERYTKHSRHDLGYAQTVYLTHIHYDVQLVTLFIISQEWTRMVFTSLDDWISFRPQLPDTVQILNIPARDAM